MPPEPGDITELLKRVRGGDKVAEADLLERVYVELHRLAELYQRRERADHTLQPTALINEAFLHLISQWGKDWHSRAHFFGVAAQVMRRVLVAYGRSHRAGKRAGAHQRVDFESVELRAPKWSVEEILLLDEALNRLSACDARQARIVELRFFAGLSEEETAEVLGVSLRTIQREWNMAKAWLYGELQTGRPARS